MMSRILGLDYGEKTIGVSISDSLLLTAQGLETIKRKEEQSIKKSINRIKEIIKEYEIFKIVLGFPKNMNNTEGERCNKTIEFKLRLERNFKNIQIVIWDERLSTVTSKKILTELGINKKRHKDFIDKIAATIILQNYLDMNNNIKRGNKIGR